MSSDARDNGPARADLTTPPVPRRVSPGATGRRGGSVLRTNCHDPRWHVESGMYAPGRNEANFGRDESGSSPGRNEANFGRDESVSAPGRNEANFGRDGSGMALRET